MNGYLAYFVELWLDPLLWLHHKTEEIDFYCNFGPTKCCCRNSGCWLGLSFDDTTIPWRYVFCFDVYLCTHLVDLAILQGFRLLCSGYNTKLKMIRLSLHICT
jgi:hypothetical protein